MSGEGGDADVRIKLVVDDGAQQTTEKLKEDLSGANKELESAKGHGGHLGNELLKANLYAELIKGGVELVGEGMHQAAEMAEKMAEASMEAADEMNQQVRASTGLLSLMDRGAHSMGDLREYAKGVREELADAGTAAGVSTGQMQDMFDKVIERGNLSSEKAKELTIDMATVGKVVPQGMEGLAQGFNMMELGIVRARNPLVQLIASTGVLKGNAHDVAKEMTKMSPAEQIEKATQAIEKQAAILKKTGGGGLGMPTLPELKASFGNLREGFLEAVGQPLLDKVIPPLMQLRDFLLENKDAIAEFGDELGQRIGGIVTAIAGFAEDVYNGVHKNWKEIVAIYKSAIDDWRSVWEMMGMTSKDISADFESVGLKLIEAFKTISGIVKASFEVAQNLSDLAHGRRYGESTDKMQFAHEEDSVKSKADTYGKDSTMDLDNEIAKYRDAGKAAGMSADAVDKFAEAMRNHHEAAMQQADALGGKVESQDFDYVSRYLNQAIANGNDAAEAYALNLLGDSDTATKALMSGAVQINGGLESLTKMIEDNAPDLGRRMKALGNSLTGVGVKGQAPSVNFYGASINIKQDFRDTDPDRIMQVFRRDLGSAATTRRQARTGSAFGL